MVNATATTAMNQTSIMKLIEATQGQSEAYLIVSILSMVVGSLVYLYFFKGTLQKISTKWKLKMLMRNHFKETGRHTVVMSHVQSGMFGSMITMEDVLEIEQLVRKIDGDAADFIINTFGGDLFASIRLSHLLKDNDNITALIPKYAWSGGTIAALGAHQIKANPSAIFGAVDPQYGKIWQSHSAKDWQKIMDKKDVDEVDDSTVAFAELGNKIMKEMRGYLDEIITHHDVDEDAFYDLFLEGDYTHSHMIRLSHMNDVGLNVQKLDTIYSDLIIELLGDVGGVFAFIGDDNPPKWKKGLWKILDLL